MSSKPRRRESLLSEEGIPLENLTLPRDKCGRQATCRGTVSDQATSSHLCELSMSESHGRSSLSSKESFACVERLVTGPSSECDFSPDNDEISSSMRSRPFKATASGSSGSSQRSHGERPIRSSRLSIEQSQIREPGRPGEVNSCRDRRDRELGDRSCTLDEGAGGDDEEDSINGRTLFLFTAKSPMRRAVYNVLMWLPWNYINAVLTFVQMVFLALETTDNFHSTFENVVQPAKKIWTSWAFLTLYSIYTIVALCKLVAFGAFTSRVMGLEACKSIFMFYLRYLGSLSGVCIQKPYPVNEHAPRIQRCFFRKSWNRVEFLSLVCFWIWFGASIGRDEQPGTLLVLISGVAQMRLLQLLDVLPITRIVLQAFKAGAPLVGKVFIFILFYWLAFSITGLSSFSSSLRRQCIWVDPAGIEANYSSGVFCGSWYHPQTEEKMPFVYADDGSISLRAKGFTCPVNSVCVSDENPYKNTLSFDNIFNSMGIIFVVMSQNTYSDIMYALIGAEYPASSLLFIAAVVVLNYWLLSLLVSILGTSYAIARDKMNIAPAKWSGSSSKYIKIFNRSLVGKIYLVLLPLAYLLITLDVAFQAAWSASSSHSEFLYYWECGVSVYLFVEAIACLLLFMPDWRLYLSSLSSCTDLVLAFVNIAILALKNYETVYSYLTFFQLFRFYRVIAAFQVARNLWTLVLGNYRSLISMTVFFFGLVFLASLIAAKMFRGSLPLIDDKGNIAPSSFFDLANSFIAMYQIASTENWTQVMYFAVENADSVFAAACIAAFFCGWLAFANFIVLNMFVAIMTDSVTSSVVDHRKEQVKLFVKNYIRDATTQREFSVSLSGLRTSLGNLMNGWFKEPIKDKAPEKIVFEEDHGQRIVTDFLAGSVKDFEPDPLKRRSTLFDHFSALPTMKLASKARRFLVKLFQRYPSGHTTTEFKRRRLSSAANLSNEPRAPDKFVDYLFQINARAEMEIDNMREEHSSFDRPLYIFGVDNPIRRFCQRIFPSSHGRRASGIEPKRMVWYSVSISLMLITVAMVIASCINTPIYYSNYIRTHNGGALTWTWFTYLDLVFAAIFLLEFVIKVVADGFYYTPNAYTYSAWNLIDFVVLLSVICTVINDFLYGPVSRYSRGLMALRALRLIAINPTSEHVFRAVFFSGLPQILGAAFLALGTMIPVAVWGKNMFHDQLRACNDSSLKSFSDCVGEYQATPYSWQVWAPRTVKGASYFNFDTFGQALLITFGILTLEGWTDVMNAVMAITGTDTNPESFSRTYNAIFPLVYNFIGTVLVMTMVIAIIIRTYTFSQGTAFLTEDQLTWQDLKKTYKMLKPKLPIPQRAANSVRRFLLDQALNPVSMINIIETWSLAAMTAFMITEHYSESLITVYWYVFGTSANCLMIAACAALKGWGQGLKLFRHDYWEIFALLISLILAALTLSLVSLEIQTLIIFDFQKAFVILIMGLWIPRIKLLRQLVRIATLNIVSILTLMQTWFILFLTWAIALNQIFGLTRLGGHTSSNKNFRSVPKALILLFQMSTGESWNQTMKDFIVSAPYCVQQNNFFETDCGDHAMAYILFISWNIVSMYIFANLFISLIYDSFWYAFRRRETNITADDIDEFQTAWQTCDPDGTGYIDARELYNLLRACTGYYDLYIYSKDPEYSVGEILSQSHARISTDPYDVDVRAIERYLEGLPVEKFRQRRKVYEMFCAHMKYVKRPGKGIWFYRSLKLFPLYKDMDPSKVLTLDEFLKVKLVMDQVKLELAAELIVRRWKLFKAKKRGDHLDISRQTAPMAA